MGHVTSYIVTGFLCCFIIHSATYMYIQTDVYASEKIKQTKGFDYCVGDALHILFP